MAIQDYLEKKIQEREHEHATAVQILADVRERMKRADAEYRKDMADPEKARKWTTIIKRLEEEYEKAHRHEASCAIEIHEKKLKLKEYIEDETARDRQLAELAWRVVNDMSVEELAMLAPEDIALLQEYELKHGPMTSAPAPPTRPADAPAKTTTPQPAASPQDFTAEHIQQLIKKLSAEKLMTLTLGEVEQLLNLYETCCRQSGGTNQERLKTAIARGLSAVDRACATFQKLWADRIKAEQRTP